MILLNKQGICYRLNHQLTSVTIELRQTIPRIKGNKINKAKTTKKTTKKTNQQQQS